MCAYLQNKWLLCIKYAIRLFLKFVLSEDSKVVTTSVSLVADLEVLGKDSDILSVSFRPDVEGGRLIHLFLVEERQRSIVITTIAVIDRV